MGKHTTNSVSTASKKRGAEDTKKYLGLEGKTPKECVDTVSNKYNLPLLIQLCEIQSKSRNCAPMIEFINKYLKDNYSVNSKGTSKKPGVTVESDTLGNIYITKGDSETYPTFVGHMDTVHTDSEIRSVHLINSSGNLIALDDTSLVGVGGDDRCGIYLALFMLSKLDNAKVCLFVDEEVGCIGSGGCDLTFFENSAYVVQFDRRGNTDFITRTNGHQVSTVEFTDDMLKVASKYEYETNTGTITDVGTLRSRGLKVASCNFSCGYYNAHSADEYINIYDLFLATEIIIEFSTSARSSYPFPIQPAPEAYSYGKYTSKHGYDPFFKFTGGFLDTSSSISKLIPCVTYGLKNGGSNLERSKINEHSIILANKIFLEGLFYAGGSAGIYNRLKQCGFCRTYTIVDTQFGDECIECGIENEGVVTTKSYIPKQTTLFNKSDNLLGEV